MTSFTGRFTPSSAGSDSQSSSVSFGADVSVEPVYLSAHVVPSRAFARLMLTLGRVVRMKETGEQKDHTAYHEWVRGEYLKELPSYKAAAALQLPGLLAERERLGSEWQSLCRRANDLMPSGDDFYPQRRKFWRWLYDHNRDAWLVLDPIVSVQPDATFFEAFSKDESVYARVRVPSAALETDAELQPGTTNIDFSVALERELSRTRTYRPLHLTVGSSAVGVSTGVSSIIERKIDLPDSWVRGLVEVQAALALAPVEVSLSAGFVADVIARLESQRERSGPRALVFRLVPQEPVSIEVQPWGDVLVDPTSRYEGPDERAIKVWGRRRLGVLADLLPHVDRVTVHLIDNGMPTFWNVTIDGVGLTIGLSGWSSQDWAGRARFSAMIPASLADPTVTAQVAVHLRTRGSLTADELATQLNLAPIQARTALQSLCVAGKAMYDAESHRYRWRALFPQLDLTINSVAGLEERKGVELVQAGSVSLITDELTPHGSHEIRAQVTTPERTNIALVETDIDGRVTYAQCDCSHFRYHKLRQGPCRHIVAANLVGGLS